MERAIKEKNQRLLKSLNIPVLGWLPSIEKFTKIRPVEEVTERVAALTLIALKGQRAPESLVNSVSKTLQGQQFFTAQERSLYCQESPEEHELIDATWRYEGIGLLLWSLSLIDSLGLPKMPFDLEDIIPVLSSHSIEELSKRAKKRSIREIEEQVDLYYQLNWACTEARIRKSSIRNLDASVVYERLYALNWLTSNINWDDVQVDS